ncbi:Cytochrome c [Roseimaritima multifibrata]|uniref:Cytochrome c n=1 Tax=Roseimaritima multifibrata TaxID=1930274 RepID=A0A517MD23_9BACT|nr:c-type cytochrome [Roseimaritima multifibrata]QDS92792.1 Cytochrome c [Roseimaritima multifibrata]
MMYRFLGLSSMATVALLWGSFFSSLSAAGLGATPADSVRVPEGFKVELVYEVPSDSEGSWVSLTVGPDGHLLACDQNGGLFKITLATDSEPVKVEPVEAAIGGAQGLLYAFDSLYVNVNGGKDEGGVYRLQDKDDNGSFESIEHILPLNKGGEHGPHALILSPDGKQIYLCGGNNTILPKEVPHSRVPRVWDEDHLLGRMPDARGHNANRLAPGGFVAKMDPDGSNFEVIATGFRNEYDIAFNSVGELFTYDADMEWDVGTPWYRPTRVNHVVSGGEFGWRNGTGKWPEYYVDSVGAVVNIGPGSPTGICFGTGAKFPAKYQQALYVLDWSYGNIFAVYMKPDGSTYTGEYETFSTGSPLPVTDIVIHPKDGNMYFTIGGRNTQSGLYQVSYVGKESTAPAPIIDTVEAKELRALRHRLEDLHFHPEANAANVDFAIENLSNADRQIRYAARIALEHQPVESWRNRLSDLDSPNAKMAAVVALARTGEKSDSKLALQTLLSIDVDGLDTAGKLDLLRAYSLSFIRLGAPDEDQRAKIIAGIDSHFPSSDPRLNREMALVLIYLNAPNAIDRVVDQLVGGPSQEDQIHYAFVLRDAKEGWDEKNRKRYFRWFKNAASSRGGMSFGGFLENIRQAAISHLDDATKTSLGKILDKPEVRDPLADLEPREMVKQWHMDDLVDVLNDDEFAYDFEQGKQMFAVAQCYKCHRIGNQGGVLGPDLTGAGGRFSPKDLLTAVIDPNQSISDQYAATQFLTDSGQVIVGKIVNLSNNDIRVMTNMLDPSQLATVKSDELESVELSKNSMMPAGLLDSLTEPEIRNLMAYLRAGGNSEHPLFKAKK